MPHCQKPASMWANSFEVEQRESQALSEIQTGVYRLPLLSGLPFQWLRTMVIEGAMAHFVSAMLVGPTWILMLWANVSIDLR